MSQVERKTKGRPRSKRTRDRVSGAVRTHTLRLPSYMGTVCGIPKMTIKDDDIKDHQSEIKKPKCLKG